MEHVALLRSYWSNGLPVSDRPSRGLDGRPILSSASTAGTTNYITHLCVVEVSMAMFEKEQAANSGPGTVVGANVKLTGTIKDVSDITVHGHVDGEVISDKNVTITETASVKGPVTAEVVNVSGKINGSVTATQRLEINPTGKIYGSINTKDLIIKSGAVFVGKSNTLKEEEEKKEEEKKVPTESRESRAESVGKEKKKTEPKYEVE